MDVNQPTLLSATWRYRWLVLVVAGFILALGVTYQLLRPPVDFYRASVTVIVQEPLTTDDVGLNQAASSQFISNQVEILRSSLVSGAAAEIVDPGGSVSSEQIEAAVNVFSDSESPLVVIEATAEDPQRAVAFANATAEGYRRIAQLQRSSATQASIEFVDAQIESIDQRLGEIDTEIADVIEADVGLSSLEEQAADSVDELASLQMQLARASGEDAEEIRTKIEDARRRITIYAEVSGAAAAGPAQRALRDEQTRLLDRRGSLLTRRDEIAVDSGAGLDSVALVDVATDADSVGGIGLARILAVALILGLAAGVALAYALSVWKRRFTGRHEPEQILEAPLLSDVPDFTLEDLSSAFPVRDYPRSAAAEAYRFASASIESYARTRGVSSVLITSPTIGHGKTTTAVNIAAAAAIHGRSVVLLDCDFGNQAASRDLLGQPAGHPGIGDIIESSITLEKATRSVGVGRSVTVDTIGRGTRPIVAAAALQTPAARQMFEELGELYDLVIVDGPPMLQVAYASTLAQMCDAVVTVIEHQAPFSEAAELADRLNLLGSVTLGYVYNRSPLRREMTMTEGSMADAIGDFDDSTSEVGARPRS